MESLPVNKHDTELVFYNKTSNFIEQHSSQLFPYNSGDYTLHVQQNHVVPSELALANTDFSMGLMDLNRNNGETALFMREHFHTDKIHAIKFTNDFSNDSLQHCILSASQDGTVKIWDRRNGEAVSTLKHNNRPFYQVDTNKTLICAGTNSELVFWDMRKMKPPLYTYGSSHTDDVTGLAYHPENPNWLISCSTDNLMCHFDFGKEGVSPQNEEDTMEGVYCSAQPLIACGFIGQDKIWTLTSINTIEIVGIENLDVIAKVEKFPHQIDFVIGCEQDRFTNKFAIYAGNNKGEMFIYELQDDKNLVLVDMILLDYPKNSIPFNQQSAVNGHPKNMMQQQLKQQDLIIRNALRINPEQIVITTECGDLKIFKYSPDLIQQNLQQNAGGVMVNNDFDLQQMMSDDSNDNQGSNDAYQGKKKHQNAKGYKPF
eukprot:403353998